MKFLALALVLGLAACGGGSSSSSDLPPSQVVLMPPGDGTGTQTCVANPQVLANGGTNLESVTNCAGATIQTPGPADQCAPGNPNC